MLLLPLPAPVPTSLFFFGTATNCFFLCPDQHCSQFFRPALESKALPAMISALKCSGRDALGVLFVCKDSTLTLAAEVVGPLKAVLAATSCLFLLDGVLQALMAACAKETRNIRYIYNIYNIYIIKKRHHNLVSAWNCNACQFVLLNRYVCREFPPSNFTSALRPSWKWSCSPEALLT